MQDLAPFGQYFFTSYVIFIKKGQWNLRSKGATKYSFMCLSHSGILTILHIMMIGNLFLTINKAKYGLPRIFHIFIIKGH